MTKPPQTLAELENLLDPGSEIDMRTTLLRVLTHLYLQRPTHSPEDEHYYTELALRLIDAADLSERAALAARLAPYPSAPQAVIARLARDVIEVAAPILKHSPCLAAADLEAIAAELGAAHAVVISARSLPAAPTAQSPAFGDPAQALAGQLSRAVLCRGCARAPADSDQSRLCLGHSVAAARCGTAC